MIASAIRLLTADYGVIYLALLAVVAGSTVRWSARRGAAHPWWRGAWVASGALPVLITLVLSRSLWDLRSADLSALTSCGWEAGGTGWGLMSVGNTLMYLPVTVVSLVLARRPLVAIAGCACFALALESLQTVLGLGVCEVSDVALNEAGIVVGSVLGLLVRPIARAERRVAAPHGVS